MSHLDNAKSALESCDGWPVNGMTDMALLAIANALVAIAEQGVESTLEHVEDKLNALADNGAERSNNGVTRCSETFVEEAYDAGFDNGMKAVLQQLDGLIHEGANMDEIQGWIDRQWEEEV